MRNGACVQPTYALEPTYALQLIGMRTGKRYPAPEYVFHDREEAENCCEEFNAAIKDHHMRKWQLVQR